MEAQAPLVAATAARRIALQMLEERGRGAVLVGVARVDAALEHLLQAVMSQSPSRDDALFRPDGPLCSLGAKVALAHRLQLIDGPVERALGVLRKALPTALARRVTVTDPHDRLDESVAAIQDHLRAARLRASE